ncbi:Circadian clock protein kinase KaiC [Caulifigura coniformis]|uniref:non-specific serine/threonine protein kinase n=1 Tax=Caulifigura coniformis TaxID=2527983 RepID=A0A517SDF6_9PLAN|nr:ATPase domain-containing protein [Caulifigura coniformis]QDT54162.1 Circadian clock protein kinase KaiC [Caulifigura coniformis]
MNAQTGIAGLDELLGGGLPANRTYLVEGNPGAGKTTLALQFLLEGIERGESCVCVTLSETREELSAAASTHGWSLDKLRIVELVASEDALHTDNQLAMFQPSELELGTTMEAILKAIEETKPTRVVIDSLSEFRLLAQNSLRYRRQILALKQFFSGRRCTVLFLDDRTADGSDLQLQSIAHGVVMLEQMSPEFGGDRRRLRIAKLRGRAYRGGYHDYIIEKGGLRVFPSLVASDHKIEAVSGQLSSGIAELDALTGGGFDFGTGILVAGPAGSGKSTLSMQYAYTAAMRGQRAMVMMFDERVDTLLARCKGVGIDLGPFVENGLVTLQQIDPAELSPGQLSQIVRSAAEGKDGHPPAQVIVIDSLNGYLNAMPEERFLVIQLHDLLTYLGHKGIVTFLVVAQHGLLGAMQTPVDTTYLADAVVLLRYFETMGAVKQAISIIKKRGGKHERTIREFRIDGQGLRIGEPLRDFQGVLSGIPKYLGNSKPLLENREE